MSEPIRSVQRFARLRFPGRSLAWLVALAALGATGFTLPPPILRTPLPLAIPAPPDGAIRTSEDAARRMTVPVMIDGKGPFPFVVDTGADRTVISTELAASLNLPIGDPVLVNGTGGADLIRTAHIDELVVGARRLSDIAAPTLAAANLGAMGMLGIDALHDQRMVIDFKHRVLSVEPSRREKLEAGVVVVRARSRYGQLVLVDAQVDNAPIAVILDSGAQNTIGNAALMKLVGRDGTSSLHLSGDVVSVTGRTTPATFSTLPKVQIGGFDLSNQPVAFAELHTFDEFGLTHHPAMLLGMDTLRVFERVVVDFRRKEVSFKLAPEPPRDFILVADAG